MDRKKLCILIIICIAIVLPSLYPIMNAQGASTSLEPIALEEARTYIPQGLLLVQGVIQVLSKGLPGMSAYEREQFERIFDPSGSGEIDAEFVTDALENYRKIERRLQSQLSLEYKQDSDMCQGMRMYYTDFTRIYVCPYFNTVSNPERKVRGLVHEIAHMALLAGDRPYYHPKTYSASYNRLTPRGPWFNQLPVIGPVLREIVRGDTLHHPDAYSWYAYLVVSQKY